MTEQEAVDAMAAIGVAGEPQRRWGEIVDPLQLRFDLLLAEFSLPDGRLEFVELSRGGHLRGILEGVDMLATDQTSAVDLLHRVTGEEPVVEEGGSSVVFPRSGAALWRGGDDERAPGRWETVAVAPTGYFARS